MMAASRKSPFFGQPIAKWRSITKRLLRQHPLNAELILEIAQIAWKSLWQTTIGANPTQISLSAVNVPATVVGYFFEILFARELQLRSDGDWRGSSKSGEKDLVYTRDDRFSIEMKTSGQRGYRVFGNRSYGQLRRKNDRQKKEKSGYYITVNFYQQTLTLLRFGWIDSTDWTSQRSETGQMAGLSSDVYQHKLITIPGSYQLQAPVEVVPGIGEKAAQHLLERGIKTIEELCLYPDTLSKSLARIRAETQGRYRHLIQR